MKTIRTEITINASPERIWTILVNFEQYPGWNPFIKTITGEKKVQGKLKVFIQPQGQKGMAFNPSIEQYQPNSHLQWIGNLWIKGLFDGRHSFKLVPLEQGKTLFIHSEQFSGWYPCCGGICRDQLCRGFCK
jgi:hypothetical protein